MALISYKLKSKYNAKYEKKIDISFKSIISDKLTNKEIKEVCLLKDKEWKFGIKSQFKWFKNNIKKYDFHNLMYIKSKLSGYTLLRKRICKIDNLKKILSIFYLILYLLIKNIEV